MLTITDIAGLVAGAADGAGLGNAFLSHIQAVDGIYHMVRCFKDKEVVHVDGSVDPIRDLETIHAELRAKCVSRAHTLPPPCFCVIPSVDLSCVSACLSLASVVLSCCLCISVSVILCVCLCLCLCVFMCVFASYRDVQNITGEIERTRKSAVRGGAGQKERMFEFVRVFAAALSCAWRKRVLTRPPTFFQETLEKILAWLSDGKDVRAGTWTAAEVRVLLLAYFLRFVLQRLTRTRSKQQQKQKQTCHRSRC